MAGAATTVYPVATSHTVRDTRSAQKLLEVNFTGVQGTNGVNSRAVASAGVEFPNSAHSLGLWIRVTNAIGGGAGDSVCGVIELLMPGLPAPGIWQQVAATDAIPFNTDGSTNNVGAGVATGADAGITPASPGTSIEILASTELLTRFPMGICSQVRIGINVNHVGVPAGTATITGELWLLPTGWA